MPREIRTFPSRVGSASRTAAVGETPDRTRQRRLHSGVEAEDHTANYKVMGITNRNPVGIRCHVAVSRGQRPWAGIARRVVSAR
jgi:hypothetical protein